jgi:hypothetical protein
MDFQPSQGGNEMTQEDDRYDRLELAVAELASVLAHDSFIVRQSPLLCAFANEHRSRERSKEAQLVAELHARNAARQLAANDARSAANR